MRYAPAVLLLATTAVGCQSKSPKAAAGPAAAGVAATGNQLTGSVLERLDAAPYIYLRISTSKGEVWAAVPTAGVEAGATVTVSNAMPMGRFESKSLNRTFDEVYFGTLTPADGAAGNPASPHGGGPPPPAAPVVVGKVEKATGSGARTIAEAWADKSALAGKTVTIRGVVVKYNSGVMSKNWIHLQDGSGDAAHGTNDISVTSLDTTAIGATITITGTVQTNRDFGAGYKYAVMVEDAKVLSK